jgi:hypothetical protein
MRLIVFLHGTVLMHHFTYPQICPEARERITSIVVPEFGGIDHLPDNPADLLVQRP